MSMVALVRDAVLVAGHRQVRRPVFCLFRPELESVDEEKNRTLDNQDTLLFTAVD